jgi:hypothetical protein
MWPRLTTLDSAAGRPLVPLAIGRSYSYPTALKVAFAVIFFYFIALRSGAFRHLELPEPPLQAPPIHHILIFMHLQFRFFDFRINRNRTTEIRRFFSLMVFARGLALCMRVCCLNFRRFPYKKHVCVTNKTKKKKCRQLHRMSEALTPLRHPSGAVTTMSRFRPSQSF